MNGLQLSEQNDFGLASLHCMYLKIDFISMETKSPYDKKISAKPFLRACYC